MAELKTSDTQLSAFLLAIGHRLTRVDGPKGRREFVFADVPEADRLAYFQDTTLVSPRRLFGCYRDLKKLLFETT